MNNKSFNEYKDLETLRINFEKELDNYTYHLECDETLKEAVRYSLLAGGKRLRPMMIFSSASILNIGFNKILNMAIAMEMIHTYSLIHDDLPAMDNDDLRRGKPTNHKVYGEAIAILAGDALLNEAHTILLRDYTNNENEVKASLYLSMYAGLFGMINGQVIDIKSEKKKIDLITLKKMHKHKTGAIIKASLVAPFILNGEKEEKIKLVEELGDKLGVLFQIQDDILDTTSNSETMGKTVGKDEEYEKSTYVTLLGLEESKSQMELLIKEVDELTNKLTLNSDNLLKDLINLIIKRKN